MGQTRSLGQGYRHLPHALKKWYPWLYPNPRGEDVSICFISSFIHSFHKHLLSLFPVFSSSQVGEVPARESHRPAGFGISHIRGPCAHKWTLQHPCPTLGLSCFLASFSTFCMSFNRLWASSFCISLLGPLGPCYQLSSPLPGLQETLGRWSPDAQGCGSEHSSPRSDAGAGLHVKAFRGSWPDLVPGWTDWLGGLHMPSLHPCLPTGRCTGTLISGPVS